MRAEEKRALRRQVRQRFPGDESRRGQSEAICAHLLQWDAFLRAGTIALYTPLAWEADLTPLLEAALAGGKRVCLPLIEGKTEISLRRVTGLNELRPDPSYGISEPPKDSPRILPRDTDLIMVPLDAADPEGYRLGKGGGFYDRLLASDRHGLTCGAVLTHQWVQAVPRDSWDQPLDWLCSPAGLICPGRIRE